MNTNVKIGIAGAIVAALVALIVLDQKTTPKDGPPPAAEPNAVTLVPGADPAGQRVREGEIDTLLKTAESDFIKTLEAGPTPPSKGTIKQGEERNQKDIRPVSGDEYVIKDKDSLEKIAKAKYGSPRYASLIVEANPELKPNAMLRVGRRIVLPPLPAKEPAPVAVEAVKAEPAAEVVKAEEPARIETAPAAEKARSYTVAQGDSLMTVSQKVFGTARHYKKIYDANKDKIADPNNLIVGIILALPDLAAAPAGTVATAVMKEPAAVPAGVHVVAEKESLWKIAEKYAASKGKGILAMMDSIVAANPDKLKDKGTPLRLGWQIAIPD